MRRAALNAGHGLTPVERSVMDRWDAGLPIAAISAETGHPTRFVSRLVSMYRIDGDLNAAETRRSSAALLAAIALHHPEMVR